MVWPSGDVTSPPCAPSGGFIATSVDLMQRPCSRAGESLGASWLGPVARTRVISPSQSGGWPPMRFGSSMCGSWAFFGSLGCIASSCCIAPPVSLL